MNEAAARPGRTVDAAIERLDGETTKRDYDRVVTELCFAVREFAINDALRNMPSEAIKEFCARKWEMRNKKIRVETKSEMRKHYPRSPDYADSVAFAVELARRLGAVAGTELKGEAQSDWRQWQDEYSEMVAGDDTYTTQGTMDYQW